MKFSILCTVFVLSFTQMMSQTKEVIMSKKPLGGVVFYEGDKLLSNRQLTTLIESNNEAYIKMKRANNDLIGATIFGIAGGGLIGWPLGSAISGGEPNWLLAGIGAGLVLVSIPFSVSYAKHANEAVNIYNEGLNTSNFKRVNFDLGISASGIGISIGF